jgi:outer membrane lipoprotein-sorting protein
MSVRTAGLTAMTALLGLLCGVPSALADAKSDPIVKKAREAAAKAKTVQADLAVNFDVNGAKQNVTGSFTGMKPNYGRLRLKGLGPGGDQELISTGTEFIRVDAAAKTYSKGPVAPRAQQLGGMPGSPISAFFEPQSIASDKHTYGGTAKANGKVYQVVKVGPAPATQRLFIGPSGLVEGLELRDNTGNGALNVTFWFKNLKLNPPLKAEQFAFVPPADFTVPKGPEDSLLAVGARAPDFLLPQPGGGQLALENTLKDKKAVLINFWFYN